MSSFLRAPVVFVRVQIWSGVSACAPLLLSVLSRSTATIASTLSAVVALKAIAVLLTVSPSDAVSSMTDQFLSFSGVKAVHRALVRSAGHADTIVRARLKFDGSKIVCFRFPSSESFRVLAQCPSFHELLPKCALRDALADGNGTSCIRY